MLCSIITLIILIDIASRQADNKAVNEEIIQKLFNEKGRQTLQSVYSEEVRTKWFCAVHNLWHKATFKQDTGWTLYRQGKASNEVQRKECAPPMFNLQFIQTRGVTKIRTVSNKNLWS